MVYHAFLDVLVNDAIGLIVSVGKFICYLFQTGIVLKNFDLLILSPQNLGHCKVLLIIQIMHLHWSLCFNTEMDYFYNLEL